MLLSVYYFVDIMKCELLEIKNGEIREICNGFMIARLRNDILLIESGTFKKVLGNIFKKETTGKQLESLADIASKENLISTQNLEINSLQNEILKLKEEHEKQLASLEGKCSVLTKRLENYTSGMDDELDVVRDRYRKHISKLEDDRMRVIDKRDEYKNKLDKTNEVLKQTEKEKEEITVEYMSYTKDTDEKKAYIRKQRNEYKNLLEQKQQELEKLKLSYLTKKEEPSDYLMELSKITSLESIVEKIFFEIPDLTERQAITLLREVKSPGDDKRRWRATTICNRVSTYLKRRCEIKQRIKKPPYNINHETNRWGESVLHDQHTQNVYNSFHVYLTKTGVKGLANVLSERSFEVLTAKEMHNLILSTLSKMGIRVGKHTYRGYLLHSLLSNRLIRSGKGNSFRYTIKEDKGTPQV